MTYPTYGTSFAETETLLATMNGDEETALRHLREMYQRERTAFQEQIRRLDRLCRQVNREQSGFDRERTR